METEEPFPHGHHHLVTFPVFFHPEALFNHSLMSCTTSVRSPLILACGLVIPVLKWSDLAGSQPATAKYRTGFLQQW